MFEERIAEMNRETETMQAHYAPEKRTYTVDEIQDRLEQSGILLAGTSEPVSHDSGCWPDADNAGQL